MCLDSVLELMVFWIDRMLSGFGEMVSNFFLLIFFMVILIIKILLFFKGVMVFVRVVLLLFGELLLVKRIRIFLVFRCVGILLKIFWIF